MSVTYTLEADAAIRSSELNRNFADLDALIATNSSDISSIDSRVSALEGATITDGSVYFYANENNSSNSQNFSGAGGYIKVQFPTIVLQDGTAYNATTYKFTCPTGGDGIYRFSFYCRANAATTFSDFSICVDSGSPTYYFIGRGETGQAGCVSGDIIVDLAEGDEVYVVYEAGATITGSIGRRGFCGHLIKSTA